ncbi:hypothetical protein [Actinophytocola algeriensis]|uniref:Uncharacterized protein n=1 Tax=Actinophytocola algeriensis TaxID=1768010 RepID=A0A7W7Q2L4_9PSEU|nr:hypothetical protein [Actinophytocola algeriensis]MBB4905870.1 hypothetical protein [Actinophytocola algeriensis]MBE1472445.1 hypothetical protein [Actinophytocola algeriensis]
MPAAVAHAAQVVGEGLVPPVGEELVDGTRELRHSAGLSSGIAIPYRSSCTG